MAKALADAEIDSHFKELIDQLAAKAPADDVTDAEIDAEVRAVRGTSQSG